MSDKSRIKIYGSDQCPYCLAASMLLKKKGMDYEGVPVGSDPGLRRKMEALSGGRTVPQIFIDGEPIGGFDELYALDSSGELDQLFGINDIA